MNIANAQFISTYQVDQMLGISPANSSFNSPAPTASVTPTTTSSTFSTGINDTTLFAGIFSLDGGNNWNPLQASVPYSLSSNSGNIQVWGESTSGTFTVWAQNNYDFQNSRGIAATVLYKVVLIAKPTQGVVSTTPIDGPAYFDSRKNYQKIAKDNYQAVSTPQTVTVPHTVGVKPTVRCFVESGGVLRSIGYYESSTTAISATSVVIKLQGTFTGTLYTRIYFDA